MHYPLIRQVFLTFLLAAGSALQISMAASHQPGISGQTRNSAETLRLIEQINKNINSKFRYLRDRDDLWLTRDDFVARGGGDCEDFALAKYQSLLEAGLSKEDFRFVYARQITSDEYHIALIHEPSGLLLDSLTPETTAISQRNDLQEEFRFSGLNFYSSAGKKTLSRAQLKTLLHWQASIRKAEAAALGSQRSQ